MSRIASRPVQIPAGVEVSVSGRTVRVKGKNGEMTRDCHPGLEIIHADNALSISVRDSSTFVKAMSGTTRALLQNMVTGVSAGFERKLEIVGVGYRAQAQGRKLNLTLGFSHPVEFPIPDGITIETPSQTEIVIRGTDKQKVGQVAANIRAYRPPEPYKGKGVKYANEKIVRKEAKKA